jgi:hypothetical protein
VSAKENAAAEMPPFEDSRSLEPASATSRGVGRILAADTPADSRSRSTAKYGFPPPVLRIIRHRIPLRSSGMLGRARRISTRLTLVAILAWRLAAPALADLYDLEGRYQCLEKPDAVCYDATPSAAPASPDPPPPAAQPAAPPPVAEAPPPKIRKGKPPPPEPKPIDPMDAIAARVQAGKLAPDDLATLRTRAKASDRRAVEMLAWCAFAGIGGAPDPVQAYILYGQAADAGSPTARKNQVAIFKGSMTAEQRQRVLDFENSRAKPGGIN